MMATGHHQQQALPPAPAPAQQMKGDLHQAIPISSVIGKCYIMPVKDYSKFKPEGFEEKDIFECEWKYTSKQRNWKKIKPTGFWEAPDHIKIVLREKTLEHERVLPTLPVPASAWRGDPPAAGHQAVTRTGWQRASGGCEAAEEQLQQIVDPRGHREEYQVVKVQTRRHRLFTRGCLNIVGER